jgi:hypothetical protein
MAKLTRQAIQHGSLTTERHKNGAQIWAFRWRESGPDGKRVRRKAIVGTLKELPTKAKAETAVAGLRLNITKEQPARVKGAITIQDFPPTTRERNWTRGIPPGHFLRGSATGE